MTSAWACGILGCGEGFESVEDLLDHQVSEHGRCTCAVCGESHPEGFLAIRHAFGEHTRAEYVRAYDASSDDIRQREHVVDLIEERVDVESVLKGLGVDAEDPAVSASD
ncbi:MAG TPA: hypothetical protein VKA37_08035 [Halobacteriales archaeon]|nr:hypothetical protein [Halobacteriales archaeon]